MNSDLLQVNAFQHKFQHGYAGPPTLMSADNAAFRLKFLGEELTELGAALGFEVTVTVHSREVFDRTCGPPSSVRRIGHALDACVDIDYVVKGTVLQMGLQAIYEPAWQIVHSCNMMKEPSGSHTKQVIKPPGWVSPDEALIDLVRELIDDGR